MKFPAFEPINLKNNTETISVLDLPVVQIIPDENQPRKNFSEESLQELALSIKKYGFLQPIIVKLIGVEKYQIIAGERRWRAAQLAGLEKMTAIVRSDCDENYSAISLVENIQREALSPIELAEAFHQLSSIYGLSHEAIAVFVGKSRASITNMLRLLHLPKDVRVLLDTGQLEMGHARAMLTLSEEDQSVLVDKIIQKNLSVRDAEKLIKSIREKKPLIQKNNSFEYLKENWIDRLSSRLSNKISVDINEKGQGKLTIHFSSPEDMNVLIATITHEREEL